MVGRARLWSKRWPVLRWIGLAAAAPALWACTSRTLEMPNITPTATLTTNFTQKINNEIDLLFMIDNSSSMTTMQQKLLTQLPTFMQALQDLPTGLPSIHVAVVSSDMGATSDQQNALKADGCYPWPGMGGLFQYAPEGGCLGTTLTAGSTYLSADGTTSNFTDPVDKVFQCIGLLGATGCGFENQLASIDHALGADNYQPDPNKPGQTIPTPPAANVGFLRPEAYLGIVMLTNEDDCSAPADTRIYSFNSGDQNIANPDGPIANYRCNGGPHGAHLCQDPRMGNATIIPPLLPPPDVQGTAATPTLDLVNCQDNETTGSSALIPVSKFVSDIKGLKTDPDNQILVAGIIAPGSPYTVEWDPPVNGHNTQPGELWPAVQHSCGPQTAANPMVNAASKQITTDGSFGDPGVREEEFLHAFPHSVEASICDPSYSNSMMQIVTKLGQLITPPCITGKIQTDSKGQPMCSVVEHLTSMEDVEKDVAMQNCNENGGATPCWTLTTAGANCGGAQLNVMDPAGTNAKQQSSTIDCSICLPGSTAPGCT